MGRIKRALAGLLRGAFWLTAAGLLFLAGTYYQSHFVKPPKDNGPLTPDGLSVSGISIKAPDGHEEAAVTFQGDWAYLEWQTPAGTKQSFRIARIPGGTKFRVNLQREQE
jgi:hypothetical protein